MEGLGAQRGEFVHELASYRGPDDLQRVVVPFVREGVTRGEPVMVAMTAEKLALVAGALGPDSARVELVDMAELGANPACIIPAWHRFLQDNAGAGPVRGVGEPIWRGRRDVELDEAELHEALLNVAFDGGRPWRLLCPYDVGALPAAVLDRALRSHPVAADRDRGEYGGHAHARRVFGRPLPTPPGDATDLDFRRDDLAGLRGALRHVARTAGLRREAAEDVVFAAHELATNSVIHGGGEGRLSMWGADDAFVAEVRDAGRIADPLVGRGLLDVDAENGRGIWLANQLCDLVQVRSGDTGTQVRLWSWL